MQAKVKTCNTNPWNKTLTYILVLSCLNDEIASPDFQPSSKASSVLAGQKWFPKLLYNQLVMTPSIRNQWSYMGLFTRAQWFWHSIYSSWTTQRQYDEQKGPCFSLWLSSFFVTLSTKRTRYCMSSQKNRASTSELQSWRCKKLIRPSRCLCPLLSLHSGLF